MLKSAMLMMGGKQEDHVLRIQGNVDVSLENGIANIWTDKKKYVEIEIPFFELDFAMVYQVCVTRDFVLLPVVDNLSLVTGQYGPVGPLAINYYQIIDWNKDALIAIT